MAETTASGWRRFWEGQHRIYVSERHRAAHYRKIADDALMLVAEGPGGVVLDYGCGDALDAARIAERCDRLLLFDAADAVRARLTTRFADAARIAVLDEAGLDALPPGAIDLILVCSVVQYLNRAELEALLARWRGWLSPRGRLVVADVVPPDSSILADVRALLASAWNHGFLLAALGGLAATFFSDYRRLRRDLGLSTHGEAEMIALLGRHGFAAARRAANFGFNPTRMTFLGRPAP